MAGDNTKLYHLGDHLWGDKFSEGRKAAGYEATYGDTNIHDALAQLGKLPPSFLQSLTTIVIAGNVHLTDDSKSQARRDAEAREFLGDQVAPESEAQKASFFAVRTRTLFKRKNVPCPPIVLVNRGNGEEGVPPGVDTVVKLSYKEIPEEMTLKVREASEGVQQQPAAKGA